MPHIVAQASCNLNESSLPLFHMLSRISESEFNAHLQNELSKRCRSNSRYSLRAFAKMLELDPSSVSQILSKKRRASPQMMDKICAKIGWPMSSDASLPVQNFSLLSQDAFAAISDWYHYAIMDLTLLKSFKNNMSWIAKRLGISTTEARIAVDRLKRLELLVEKNGKLEKKQQQYVNYLEGQTSEPLKEYQRQIIKKALEAVDGCPAESKDITCITIAANPKKLALAKNKIKKFRRELCAFLEDGEGDSVHVLALQLFPLTKDEEN